MLGFSLGTCTLAQNCFHVHVHVPPGNIKLPTILMGLSRVVGFYWTTCIAKVDCFQVSVRAFMAHDITGP